MFAYIYIGCIYLSTYLYRRIGAQRPTSRKKSGQAAGSARKACTRHPRGLSAPWLSGFWAFGLGFRV